MKVFGQASGEVWIVAEAEKAASPKKTRTSAFF